MAGSRSPVVMFFRTMQLRVSGEAIFFDRLVVHFDDGTSRELMVCDRISPEGNNYVIDLLGERSLESVELWYYKESWVQNPTVSVYGSHSLDPGAQANVRTLDFTQRDVPPKHAFLQESGL